MAQRKHDACSSQQQQQRTNVWLRPHTVWGPAVARHRPGRPGRLPNSHSGPLRCGRRLGRVMQRCRKALARDLSSHPSVRFCFCPALPRGSRPVPQMLVGKHRTRHRHFDVLPIPTERNSLIIIRGSLVHETARSAPGHIPGIEPALRYNEVSVLMSRKISRHLSHTGVLRDRGPRCTCVSTARRHDRSMEAGCRPRSMEAGCRPVLLQRALSGLYSSQTRARAAQQKQYHKNACMPWEALCTEGWDPTTRLPFAQHRPG